jgi:ATP-dependent RNA helicase DDX47/RRP3
LTQNYLFIPAKYKDCYLVYVLNEFAGNSTIIFTTTCNSAMRVSLILRNLGFGAIPLHGQMSQPSRLGALNKFRSKSRSILVATDVASRYALRALSLSCVACVAVLMHQLTNVYRGLDIPHVDLILNFDIPTNSKDYIHRVGRTARAGRGGRSISFVTQYDVELFQRIEALIEKKMELFPTQEETVLVFLERVNEAQRYATMVSHTHHAVVPTCD